MNNMQPKVFRYDDLYMLRGPHFISDSIIDFYFNYLSSTNRSNPKDILLVSPSVSFWVGNCHDQDSIKECLEPLDLPSKNLVIFPVNNSHFFSQDNGGTHWSLLVFCRNMNAFVHHDTMRGLNYNSALALFNSVKSYFNCPSASSDDFDYYNYLLPLISKFEINKKKRKNRILFRTDGSMTTAAAGGEDFPGFVEGETPQQSNGHDCGLYVMAIAKVICQWYENACGHSIDSDDENVDNWFFMVNQRVHKSLELSMRSEVLKIITDQAILV